MTFFKHKNISKTIILAFIFIILTNSLLISFFYLNNQWSDYETNESALSKQSLSQQKKMLKASVDKIVDDLDFWFKSGINRDIMIKWISQIEYDKEKSDYFFVYKLWDISGGDKFAKLLINPNRPDIIGQFISDSYTDINGKAFRKEFLKGIRKDGESFVEYSYKKASTGKVVKKISYFKYYENLSWIVARGVYADDIVMQTSIQKTALKEKVKKQIGQNLIAFIAVSIIAVMISLIIGKKIESVLTQKNEEVKNKRLQLVNLNKTLEKRVAKEVAKAKQKDEMLMRKSKFIALGEMISNIAHQWRQPISELSAIFMNLKMKHDLGLLTHETMQNKSKEAESLLEYMSNTIDDFRNFFKPDKRKKEFNVKRSIEAVFNIISSSIENEAIDIQKEIDEKITLYGYENEFEQVLLNMINNSKDALIANKIEKPFIFIKGVENNSKVEVHIKDNAGGIKAKPIEKIFEPYFTTKDEGGTGIGLYMSKMIIETNMHGELNVQNDEEGAEFTLVFDKST